MKKTHRWLSAFVSVALAFAVAGCQIDSDRHEHSFSKDWTSNATDHWHAATCGHTKEVSDKAAHTFGEWKTTVEATEETEGKKERICSVCLYKEEQSLAKLDHTHKFSSDWTSDAIDHWHAATCGHTKEVSDKTAHTFGEWKTTVEATEETEGKKERICNVCSYKEEQSLAKLDHTHKFSSDWTSNATDHWHNCSGCEEVSGKTAHIFGEWTVTKTATCTEKGSRKRTCSVCKYEATEDISAKGHAYSEDWTSDATDHWHNCSGCKEVSGKTAHTFGDWTVTKTATCTEKGSRKRTCSVCKYEATEDISAKGHAYSEDWTSDLTYHWHKCSGCKEVRDKAAHTFGEWETTVEATEKTEGKKERSCSVCSYKEEQSIAKLDHTHKFSSDWTSNTTDHWHVATCEHAEEVSGKTAHTFGEWKTTVEATEEAEGSKERSCSVCGYKATEAIEKLAHTHKFATAWASDTSGHWHAAICEHTDEKSGFAEHTFGEYVSNNDATTEADGTKTRECSVCGYKETVVDEGSKIHVHTFAEEWTSDETYHWHSATCGHDVTDSKAAHTFGEYVSNNDATTEADGTKTRECSVCGYKDTVTDEGSKIIVPEGFVLIPAGTFQMGSNVGYSDNKPVHEVTITKPFYMGKYEVTQAEYEKYCSYGGSSPSSDKGDGDNYPAYYVSWYDALVYCNKRSMAEGLTPCYSISGSTDPSKWGTVPTSSNNTWNAVVCNWNANGYRLPTEAEWEYAARAEDNTVASLTYSGTSDVNKLGEYAWYSSNSNSKTHEVGTKKANGFGLYDMSGNVWEWCWNWFTNSYDAETEGGSDPTGPSAGSARVRRGGSWSGNSDRCAVSCRNYLNPYYRNSYLGFRVVRASSK